MRDTKHRVLTTIVTVISLAVCFAVFQYLSQTKSIEVAAVIAFILGILIVLFYQIFNYKNLSHSISRVNSLTQIWLGLIIIVAGIITVLLNLSFGVEFSTALIWMAGLVLLLLFLTIKHFDSYLEKKVDVGKKAKSK
jgi:peptidoglycan biosynthesis protein MviN/MurJ (putative lipid II flippase)